VAWSRSDAVVKLKGVTGPAFQITLKKGGKKVKTLKAGKYKFTISDKSSAHNFALKQVTGGKYRKVLTGVTFVGTKTVTVKLKKGKWEFYCVPHESLGMRGFFRVK
jgi:plastocyanin